MYRLRNEKVKYGIKKKHIRNSIEPSILDTLFLVVFILISHAKRKIVCANVVSKLRHSSKLCR